MKDYNVGNREIRFKCWDNEGREWVGAECGDMDLKHSGRYNTFLFDNDSFDIPKNVVWCQLTGLTDKNGKEIYEGDIVLQHYANADPREQVVKYVHDGFNIGNTEYVEVIGNIFESPELIKQDDKN